MAVNLHEIPNLASIFVDADENLLFTNGVNPAGTGYRKLSAVLVKTMADLASVTPSALDRILVRQNSSNLMKVVTVQSILDQAIAAAGTELIQDTIGNSLVAGTGITINYDDPSGLTTISGTPPYDPLIERRNHAIHRNTGMGANGNPRRGVFCPTNNCIYTIDFSTKTCQVFDLAVPRMVTTINLTAVSNNPRNCVYVPWMDRIFVLYGASMYAIIDPNTNTVTTSYAAIGGINPTFDPDSISQYAVDEVGQRIYAVGSYTVLQIDPVAATYTDVFYDGGATLGSTPTDCVWVAATGRLYVVEGGTVKVFSSNLTAGFSTTIAGMLSNPSYGGNFGKAGWKWIGFNDQFSWVAPFGAYDRT